MAAGAVRDKGASGVRRAHCPFHEDPTVRQELKRFARTAALIDQHASRPTVSLARNAAAPVPGYGITAAFAG